MTTEHKPLDVFGLMRNAMHSGARMVVVTVNQYAYLKWDLCVNITKLHVIIGHMMVKRT